jgi:hypothetical protein
VPLPPNGKVSRLEEKESRSSRSRQRRPTALQQQQPKAKYLELPKEAAVAQHGPRKPRTLAEGRRQRASSGRETGSEFLARSKHASGRTRRRVKSA